MDHKSWLKPEPIECRKLAELNEQERRNVDRFPPDFMFQLTPEEKLEVVTNCDHLSRLRFSPVLPYAFTEHEVANFFGGVNEWSKLVVSLEKIKSRIITILGEKVLPDMYVVRHHKQGGVLMGKEDLVPQEIIESKIFLIRGKKVMMDRDLAVLYGVTTGNLNRAVRRNLDRFPEDFMFQLTN
jgi:hypothetical protein